MSMRAVVQAWAKVNLDLRILAREASGFHQLETIFLRISLADQVEVQVARGTGTSLQCTPPVDVPDARNLAWRAADAYRTAAQWPDAAHAIAITIAKHIPTGGGLGGGSADAGAVLRALNALNPHPLPPHALLTLAATLGADVPFLTGEVACALAWGRGERMLALLPLPPRTVHLALFERGVDTAEAYDALAAARADGRVVTHGATMHTIDSLHDWASLASEAGNDFEAPVFAQRADVGRVHADWCAAAPAALVRMSGSGATVFAIADAAQAAALADVAATWAPSAGVRHLQVESVAAVPPVVILSPASGSR